jgi:hypothetical protein
MTSLTFLVERIKETFLPNNLLLLDSNKMRIMSTLQGGQQLVEHSGTLRILFSSTSKIQFMELGLTAFEHFVNSKCENLFTLPLQAGFDQTVHNFLEMLVLVQASFGNMGNLAGVSGMSSTSSLPGLANLTLDTGYHQQQDPSMSVSPSPINPTILKSNHLPTLLPRPPAEAPKPTVPQPVLPKISSPLPPLALKFEMYTPPQQDPPSTT